jgi:hypothetical protein
MIRSLIDQVKVDDPGIGIIGRKSVLERLVMSGRATACPAYAVRSIRISQFWLAFPTF